MAVVMGGLVVSFAIWGIGDIFRGFGLNSAVKIGDTEISIEQFRQFYNDRLQQLGRQARPADHARSGARARPRPANARPIGGRDHARRAGQGLAARHQQCRNRQPHHQRSRISAASTASSTARASSRSSGKPASAKRRFVEEQRRVHAAPADRAQHQRRIARAGDGADGDQSISRTRSAAIEYLTLGPAQAGDIPAPTPEVLEQIFRGAQGFVPRAGIPQDHAALDVAGRPRQAGRGLRRRRQELITSSTRRTTARPSGASCTRSCSRTPKRPRPRASASPRARALPISPRSAA